jgi:hypothetical protein
MTQVNVFGPLDNILAIEIGIGEVLVIEAILLVLVLANLATRHLAHNKHVEQAEEGAEAVSRFIPHEITNVVLLLGSFYYMTVDYHPGMVLSVLVLGMFLTDFFEFESRKVEARRDIEIESPKGALVASLLVFAYIGYQVLFFIIEGPFSAIV